MTTTNVYIPKAWENVNCPFCNSGESDIYEKFGSSYQYAYVTCRNCGLIYTKPRPKYDQDFLDAAYASYYQFAENITVNDLDNIKESSLKLFEKEIVHLLKYDKEKKAVLDIGSGMGTFLLAAKKYYPVAEGMDVSLKMAAFVEKNIGVKVHIGQFENFNPPHKFSLIHMSHVIEHIPNPNEWVQHAKELLTPDGILVINVPNKYSLSFRLQHFFYKAGLKKQFSDTWSDPSRTPDHLFEPTIRSMKYFLDKNRFEILEYYTYSRKDATSDKNWLARFMHRSLKIGSNLAFITKPKSV
jgi:2-polyprenyl-3-methyl-5-hydroxy-6-metoxy-1,4-benzoquinol methylase